MNRVYINPLWCYVSVLVTISYLPMLPCPPFPLKIRPPFPPFPPFRLTPSWRPCWQLPTWDWKTEKMSRKNLSNCFLPVGCPNYHPVIGLLHHPHYWRNGDWGPRRGYLRIDLKKKRTIIMRYWHMARLLLKFEWSFLNSERMLIWIRIWILKNNKQIYWSQTFEWI